MKTSSYLKRFLLHYIIIHVSDVYMYIIECLLYFPSPYQPEETVHRCFFIIWYLYYKVSHTYWSRAKQRTVVSAFPYHICLRQFSIQCFKCNNQKIMWLSSSCLLKYKKGMKNIEYWFYMRKPPTNFSSHSNRHINSSTRVVCHFVSLFYTRICQSSSRWFKKPIELQIYI